MEIGVTVDILAALTDRLQKEDGERRQKRADTMQASHSHLIRLQNENALPTCALPASKHRMCTTSYTMVQRSSTLRVLECSPDTSYKHWLTRPVQSTRSTSQAVRRSRKLRDPRARKAKVCFGPKACAHRVICASTVTNEDLFRDHVSFAFGKQSFTIASSRNCS